MTLEERMRLKFFIQNINENKNLSQKYGLRNESYLVKPIDEGSDDKEKDMTYKKGVSIKL